MIDTTFDRLVTNYQALSDWDDRFSFIIGLGKQLPIMDDSLKVEDRRVLGCMSRVWIGIVWGFFFDVPVGFFWVIEGAVFKGFVANLFVFF